MSLGCSLSFVWLSKCASTHLTLGWTYIYAKNHSQFNIGGSQVYTTHVHIIYRVYTEIYFNTQWHPLALASPCKTSTRAF